MKVLSANSQAITDQIVQQSQRGKWSTWQRVVLLKTSSDYQAISLNIFERLLTRICSLFHKNYLGNRLHDKSVKVIDPNTFSRASRKVDVLPQRPGSNTQGPTQTQVPSQQISHPTQEKPDMGQGPTKTSSEEEKATMRIIYRGLPGEPKPCAFFAKKVESFQQYTQDRKVQEETFGNTDTQKTFIFMDDFASQLSTEEVKPFLRYLVVEGEIAGYCLPQNDQPHKGEFYCVFTSLDALEKHNEKVMGTKFTKELLIEIDNKLQNLHLPEMPTTLDKEYEAIWKNILQKITQNHYERIANNNVQGEVFPEYEYMLDNQLKYKKIFNELVHLGVIYAWNRCGRRDLKVCVKLEKEDPIRGYALDESFKLWRNKEEIERIDALQKERHISLPVISQFSPKEQETIKKLVATLNEKEIAGLYTWEPFRGKDSLVDFKKLLEFLKEKQCIHDFSANLVSHRYKIYVKEEDKPQS